MRGRRWGAVALLGLAMACSSNSDSSSTTTTTTEAPTPTFMGDGSKFCNAMLSLGQVSGASGKTPQQVLAANEALVSHLDEAQANTPADAPPDFDSLIDDYRLATTAIFDAAGDVTKAFEALKREHPDAYARLGSETSHKEAYGFLADRCGINPP